MFRLSPFMFKPTFLHQQKYQQGPNGEGAKQRASEQPIFTNLCFEKGLHKDVVLP